MTTLAICIPTYNRARFLPTTLEAIAAQWDDALELTVADNGSTDDTEALVDRWRSRLGRVRYFRWPENGGADRNYLKAIELATSPWCWLHGSDDRLRPGAVQRVLRALQDDAPDLALCDRMLCTHDLRPVRHDRFLEGHRAATRFAFDRPGALAAYLQAGTSVCAAFSYVSSVVVRKAAWDAIPTDESFIGTAYVHVQKLLGVCRSGARLTYLPEPLVDTRLGNDSFRDQGLARRVLIDLEGFPMLAERCLAGDPEAARGLVTLLRHEYPFGRLLRYRGILGADPAWPTIARILRAGIGHRPWVVALAFALGRIHPLVRLSFWWRDLWAARSARQGG